MINILFAGAPEQFSAYRALLEDHLLRAGIDADISLAFVCPWKVDYIIFSSDSDLRDFTPFTRCKVVLNLWAGVESLVRNKTLTQPLCRMVDTGLRQGMIEWTVAHTLRYHLGLDAHIINPDNSWEEVLPPLALERPVTILGVGQLGTACARALTGLGFPVTGWSRHPKAVEGVKCLHGTNELDEALKSAHILIVLLPDTSETNNIINERTIAQMPRGSCILNAGRGSLIEEAALLTALDSGHLSAACLDVFRTEPLPETHPFWAHPKVTITPHIASGTRISTASKVLAENIIRGELNRPFLHEVDRQQGY